MKQTYFLSDGCCLELPRNADSDTHNMFVRLLQCWQTDLIWPCCTSWFLLLSSCWSGCTSPNSHSMFTARPTSLFDLAIPAKHAEMPVDSPFLKPDGVIWWISQAWFKAIKLMIATRSTNQSSFTGLGELMFCPRFTTTKVTTSSALTYATQNMVAESRKFHVKFPLVSLVKHTQVD